MQIITRPICLDFVICQIRPNAGLDIRFWFNEFNYFCQWIDSEIRGWDDI